MSNYITVNFSMAKEVNGKKSQTVYKVNANPNETVKELLLRFLEQTGLSSTETKFYFSGKNLYNYETQTLAHIGIVNNSIIEVAYIVLEACHIIEANPFNLNNDNTEFNNNYNYGNNNNIQINKIKPYPNNDNNAQKIQNFGIPNPQNIIITQKNNNDIYANSGSYLKQLLPRKDQSQYTFNNIYPNNENKIIKNINNSLISKPNPLNYEISIKFIRYSNNSIHNCDAELKGILKLCYLNEIASKIPDNTLNYLYTNRKIPEIIYFILEILRKNYVNFNNNINEAAKVIQKVIGKEKGCNILNFSNFVDEQVNQYILQQLRNNVNPIFFNEIDNIKLRLGKYQKYEYMSFFENELKKSLRDSVIEFLPVSLAIIDRHDFDKFNEEMAKCPNRQNKLLYHGTQVDPVSCILIDKFIKAETKCIQHGQGVYFTDSLDYCYFYGGSKDNRSNMNKIPLVGDSFTAICSVVYYDVTGFLQVKDYKTRLRPGKNQVNFAYAASTSETIVIPDYRKFVGTEYVIYEDDQICPLISVRFKREEYCVIWRDVNFSDQTIYGNKFDKEFKNFLKARLRYINQMAKYNVYTFTDSNEALRCVERKKHNKIILISNVGDDHSGKLFINEARKIIENDVLVLFNAYNPDHLHWITTEYQNALFSNKSEFCEEYLESFNDENKMKGLIAKLENHYHVKFNIDNDFLNFPLYRESGLYSELTFNQF